MDVKRRWFGWARVLGVCALACLGASAAAIAQTGAPAYTVLHDFRGDLSAIWAGVTLAPDGSIYGTTYDGGASNKGSVFVLRQDGSGGYAYQTLHDFTGAGDDGASPAASLLLARDGNLYGTTMAGGPDGWGTVFRVDGATGQVVTLHSFAYTDGAYPQARLIEASDGLFYGTTGAGGSSPVSTLGTVFKMDLAGTITTLHVFTGAGDGEAPLGALTQASDGFFYGTTSAGGNTGEGTVFRMDASGAVTLLHSFRGATEGSYPTGSLVERAGAFYGTAFQGGPNGSGTVFRFAGSGSLTIVHTFAGPDGANPAAGLLLASDGSLYGTTSSNSSNSGSVFRISPTGSFVPLHDFGGSDGVRPRADLVEGADGAFYGTTSSGGLQAAGEGTVFRMDPSGGVATLYRFSSDSPATPWGGLVQATDGVYGTTITGGSADHGALFRMSPAGAVSTLHSFEGADGSAPFAALVEATDGNLYGVASEGGANGLGTVFRLEPSGTVTTLHEFLSSDGGTPRGRLIQASDGNLYGTTFRGGAVANGRGTVFRVSLTGAFTLVHTFDGSDGGEPLGGVVEGRDGNLYGTTSAGGVNDMGAVFRIDPEGVLTLLHSFGGNDGSGPQAGPIEAADGNLYGTTVHGGSSGQGTLFRISASGVPSILHEFTVAEGQPYSRLLEASDGNLYGTTALGGTRYGSVFRVDTAGTLTTLHGFQFYDGAYPYGDLVQMASGSLWGVTYSGGAWNRGVAYELSLGLAPPTAVASGSTNICEGSSAPLSGSGGVSCSWSPVAGLDDPSSCTPSASPANTTTYTLTVTDAAGQRSVNKPTVTVTLDCTILTVSPKVLDFGRVPLNTTKDLVVTVTNGTAALVAFSGNFFLQQSDPQPFDASAFDSCAFVGTLSPGQSCTHRVRFISVPGADAASPVTMLLLDANTSATLATVDLVAATGPPVTGPNNPPIAVDDLAGVSPGFTQYLNPLDNDSDPDNDILHIIAVSHPPHGIASVIPCNVWPVNPNVDCVQYLPDAAYLGLDSFVYTVSDGRGGTASATYHLALGNVVPNIASVTPSAGPTAGGQSVRISGNDFLYRSDVAFVCGGSVLPLTVTQLTDTEILASTPPAPAGICDLQVRSLFGQVGRLANAYTYVNSSVLTPVAGGLVSGTLVAVNTGPGDQTDPHVSGDLMTYTSVAPDGGTVRYYDFATGLDAEIVRAHGEVDTLSDVSGRHISFSRQETDRRATMVFDADTLQTTEIDPQPGSSRFVTAIGGDTVASLDANVGNGDIHVWDLVSGQGQIVGASPLYDSNPNVAPDGNTIVWETCDSAFVNCDIMKAERRTGSWVASPVTQTQDPELNPDTDGTWIVYDAQRVGNPTGPDIYYTPLAGGTEVRLALPGLERNPSISRGVISFESKTTVYAPADLYVYVIATNTLYQVTNTPTIDESLNDVTVLPNGDIRVVWAANDGVGGESNVYAMTFTPIAPGQSTTTSLTSSLNPSPSGQDVTFTAAVVATSGTATGSVTFYDGSSVLGTGTLDGSGAAMLATSSLAVGTHSITAVYSGDATHAASTSAALTQTVNAAPPVVINVTEAILVTDTPLVTPSLMLTVPETITVTDSPTVLPSVMLTVPETITVTDAPGINVPPAAQDIAVATTAGSSITIALAANDANNDPLAFAIVIGPAHGSLSAVLGNQVTYTPAFGYAGLDSFTFKASDGQADSNVATVSISIGIAATATSLTSSPNPSVGGQSVTFTATVSAGGVSPAGEVEFSYPIPGAVRPPVILGRASLDAGGIATFATTDLLPGQLVVTATYLGGGGFGSSSAFVIQNVAKAPTTTTLVSNGPTSLTTKPAVFTATVGTTAVGTVSGQVEFFADGVSLGRSPVFTRNGSQIAVRGGAALTVGAHSITAGYVGDSAHEASTSLALTETVFEGSYFAIDLTPAATDPAEATAINESNWVVGFSTHADPRVGFPINAGFLYSGGALLDLGSLGGASTVPSAINDAGRIVGQSTTTPSQQAHAFVYENGQMTDLGTLGGGTSRALAINSVGQIVGMADTGSGTHGFLYQNGVITDLGTLGGDVSVAASIDADGFIAGFATLADETPHAARAPSWFDLGTLGGTTSRAVAINDAGQIAGTSDLPGDLATHSFLWQDGSTTDLAGTDGPPNTAYAINDAGQVVGWTLLPAQTGVSHETPPTPLHAFIFSSAGFTELGALSGGTSQAVDVSNAGMLVGFSDGHAFASSGGALTDLGTLGGPTSFARAINDRGVIVGSADMTSGLSHATAWLPVAASTLTLAPASGPAGGATTLVATLSALGVPIPNAIVTCSFNAIPAGLAVTDASGTATLSGVPLGGFSAGTYPGVIHAAYAANSVFGGSSAVADLTVTSPPQAGDDAYSTNEDTTLSVPAPGVLANDINVGGGIAVPITQPAHGTLILRSDGSFDYAPSATFLGSDTFTYKVTAGGVESNVATVTLTVAPVDHPPVASDDDYATGVSSLTVPEPGVLGNDTDPDGDSLTAVLVSRPSQGAVALHPDGSFTYTPNPGAMGDSFTYQALARGVPSNVATVRIGRAPDFQGLVSAQRITINDGPGDQTEPRVSGNLMSYTSSAGAVTSIHYYDFATGMDAAIPQAAGDVDTLNDVDGRRISFSRQESDRRATMVFDADTLQTTEIDPQPGSSRFATALGGDTVAFLDAAVGNGDIQAWSLASGQGQVVGASASFDGNPNVAPDGNTIVWERCDSAFANCDVIKAERRNGSWLVSPVAQTPDYELNPHTDGTWIVYDADRTGDPTGPDIYLTPLAGGPEVRLVLPGLQRNPSINRGVISFETKTAASTPADLYVYVIATNKLYQLTNTPTIDESLNDVTVLPNGDIRVVWAANDGVGGESNIYATTFTPGHAGPPPVAADDTYTTSEDAPLGVQAPGVLANDANVTGGTAVPITQPAHGTLAFRSDGSFDYTPAATFFGSDTFTYKVTAGGVDSNLATVTLTVAPVDHPPVASDDDYATGVAALTVPAPGVLGNDTDADGDPLTAVLVSGPSQGAVALNPDGSFTYTPNLGAMGDSFTYQAMARGVASNVATVRIGIAPDFQGVVSSQRIAINAGPGDQTEPHVDGDLMTYTDSRGSSTSQIRYYRFSTGVDQAIPAGAPGEQDFLSDVNGSRVVFSRQRNDASLAAMLFDMTTPTPTPTEIDPTPGSSRFGTAIGADTIAFADFKSDNGDIEVWDLPSAQAQVVGASALVDQNPHVSPDGQAIVWERCVGLNCDVLKAQRLGGSWNASPVTNTPGPEANPDTDGTWIVYDGDRTGNPTGPDIYLTPLAGGGEFRLALPGVQRNPHISHGMISFESIPPLGSNADLYVYVIGTNKLYQVTDTPSVNEQLSDVSVLSNGDIRVVWAANDDVVATDHNVYATTFNPGGLDTAPPSVTLTTPNGGERVFAGTPYLIRWTASDDVGVVSIDVASSSDGGATFIPVPGCTGMAGTAVACTWSAPGPATIQGRIRVTARDAAGNSSSATSGANFSVVAGTASVTLTAPNTAVTWAVGSTHNITWNHNLGTSQSVNIDVSRDGGATWSSVATNVPNSAATTGRYAWTVTGPPSPTARVRVSWAADPTVKSVSAVNFILSGTIAVTSPTGNLGIGSTRTVTWSHTLGAGQTFKILLSTDGGATYPTTIASNVGAGATSGSYPWVVSGPASATTRLRVAWAAAPSVAGSTGNLTMAAPTLTVNAPNTAVNWTIGDTRSITWSHNLGTQESADIDESLDGGNTWSSIATGVTNTASTTGTFTWLVTGPATTTARVRVTWSQNAAVTDTSNVSFTILDRIRITAPNTAVTWAVGSTHNITWNHNLGTSQSVTIDVSRDGGASWASVATNVPNSAATTGTYAWPVTGPPSATARVRVSWAADPSVTSVSAVNFILSGTIAATSPTGNLGIGSTRTVTWSHTLGAGQTFNILLSTDGGATYPTTIASNVGAGATSGSYPWVVSGPASATTRLRVAWAAAPSVAGSTGNLTMAAPTLTVNAPNTAVTWTIGTSRAITWSHNLGTQEAVDIDESLDGGTTWSSIAAGVANTANAAGTFNWLVTGPATTTARIRVTWNKSAAVTDMSNVNFTIR